MPSLHDSARFLRLPLWLVQRTDLTPADKIVFAALTDRIGQNGECWPGQRRLGKDCGLPRSTVSDSVAALERAGLVEVVRVDGNPGGKTNRYRLAKASDTRTSDARTSGTAADDVRHPARDVRHPDITRSREPDQGTRLKRAHAPRKQNPADLERLYQAYPRKIGKGAALKAIGRALDLLASRGEPDPAAWLLERVQAFAASPASRRGKFTPHPATWFNQERYDDDPVEWSRADRTPAETRDEPGRVRTGTTDYDRLVTKC